MAHYLDLGKPAELIEFARHKECRNCLPQVIRLDLVLTDKGWIIAEVDSVPAGSGSHPGLIEPIPVSVKRSLAERRECWTVLPRFSPDGGDIVISAESATYRPEMEYLVRQLNARFPERSWKVVAAENYSPQPGRDVYRFFELFDLPNVPRISDLVAAVGRAEVSDAAVQAVSSREKMWFAFFWLKPLREFWRRELGDKYFRRLREMIPYTWILDPTSVAAARSHSAA